MITTKTLSIVWKTEEEEEEEEAKPMWDWAIKF